jgi:hypothetical protein
VNTKYVFTELVTDSDNPEQLLAYALYKREKQQLASELHAQGKSHEEIDTALKYKHDNTVNSEKNLDAYRDQATVLLNTLIQEAKRPLQFEFDNYKEKEQRRVEDEAKKLNSQWLKKVDLQRIDDQNAKIILFWNKIWTALTSGVRKYLVGLLIATVAAWFGVDRYRLMQGSAERPTGDAEQRAAQ